MNIISLFSQKKIVENDNLNILLRNYVNFLTNNKTYDKPSKIDFFDYETQETGLSSETISGLKLLSDHFNAVVEEVRTLKKQAHALETFLDLYKDSGSEYFYENFLRLLSKQMNAWQSILFLREQDHLKAETGYAFNVSGQTVQLGEGLVGQCFKEKKIISMRSTSDVYFQVGSGLGRSKDVYILLLPVLYGEEIMGVLELSGFQEIHNMQVEFAEKVSSYLGSVIYNNISTENNRRLVQEAQERAHTLLEQEEQLRQNIEELSASQEEMERKKIIIDQQGQLMKMIVDYIPFPVFVKDEEGRYTLINKAEAELLGTAEENIIGKSDYHFVQNDSEWKIIQQSDQRVLNSEYPIELKEQEFTTPDGKSYLFKTTKVPFVNNITGKKNILGVSIDLATFRYAGKSKEKENGLYQVANNRYQVSSNK